MANASPPERDLIAALKAENARLVALLEQHGIAARGGGQAWLVS